MVRSGRTASLLGEDGAAAELALVGAAHRRIGAGELHLLGGVLQQLKLSGRQITAGVQLEPHAGQHLDRTVGPRHLLFRLVEIGHGALFRNDPVDGEQVQRLAAALVDFVLNARSNLLPCRNGGFLGPHTRSAGSGLHSSGRACP
jgi:hypothetical protein